MLQRQHWSVNKPAKQRHSKETQPQLLARVILGAEGRDDSQKEKQQSKRYLRPSMKVLLVHCPVSSAEMFLHSSTLFPQDLISSRLHFYFCFETSLLKRSIEDLLMLHSCFRLSFFSLMDTCIKLNSPDKEPTLEGEGSNFQVLSGNP